jgi:hypothetical protein
MHEEEKVGSVSKNLMAHITGCTLLSTLTLKHANTAENKQGHIYPIVITWSDNKVRELIVVKVLHTS